MIHKSLSGKHLQRQIDCFLRIPTNFCCLLMSRFSGDFRWKEMENNPVLREESCTMYGSLGITLRDIQCLTRWGRVAFAARCARRAKQVLERLGMDAGDPSMRICDEALQLAEDSAARALPQDKLNQAMMGLSQLAVSAVTPPEGMPVYANHQSPDDGTNLIVYNVAHAAFAATRAAQ